ncbi:MAG: lysophospholipase, partial [Saprospiraceae bacterium]
TYKKIFNNNNFLIRNWIIDNPRANIILLHGYGEHSKRYEETAKVLNNVGFAVYSYDRRGEGESTGKKGHINRFDIQVEDLIAIKNNITTNNNIKTYLMGHSLGGLICVKYLIDYTPDDISGLILSSPLLKSDKNMAPTLQKMAKIVSFLMPWLPTVKLDSNHITKDLEQQILYKNDPLIYHGKLNARTGYEILKAIKHVQNNFGLISLPYIVLHGSDDKIADPNGSKLFHSMTISKEKTIKILEGLYHEMMREPEKQMFFKYITEWLDDKNKNTTQTY